MMAERKYYRKVYQGDKRKRKTLFLFKILGGSFLFLLFSFSLLFIYYAKDFPRPEEFTERKVSQ